MMEEHCSMHHGGSTKEGELTAHVWTNGDLNKLVLIHCWLEQKHNKRLLFCQPNLGNKYKWDAFIRNLEWEEGKELCEKVKHEFF